MCVKILHADHFCQEKNFLLIDAKNKLQEIGTLPVIHVVISFYKVKCFYTNACYTSFSFVFTTYTNTLSQHSGFICFASIIDILNKTKMVISYA